MMFKTRVHNVVNGLSCNLIQRKIVSYIKDHCDIAVIGLSGGADSTLVAILCKTALGADNVYGISMPYNDLDVQTFNSRSAKLASALGINHKTIPITSISQAIDSCVSNFMDMDVTQLSSGNARSRSRMTVLYGVAGMLNGIFVDKRSRVIGTGNLSEDFLGYDTCHGDAAADFFPIGDLYKQEVYDMLDYFKEQGIITEEHIDRIPSAGLWDGQTDESELGFTYNEMAPAIEYFRKFPQLLETPDDIIQSSDIIKFVRERHLANRHKHMAPPVCVVK